MPDVDIDFADRTILLDKLKHRIAKLDTDKKHNTGVYFTEVPHDPATNMATIDYETAEDRNYFKAVKILAKHDENYMPPEVAESLKEN